MCQPCRGRDANQRQHRRRAAAQLRRGHFIVVCHFSCWLSCAPGRSRILHATLLALLACCSGTYLNGLVLIHNSWRRDYLAKMLLKKLYVNQLQANKNSTQEPHHHALESGIFNFLFWRVRRKDVSIVVAFQYTGYTLWSEGTI